MYWIFFVEETQGFDDDGIIMNPTRNLLMSAPGITQGIGQSMQIHNDWTTPRMNPRRRAIQRVSPGTHITSTNQVYPPVPHSVQYSWQPWSDTLIMQQTSLPMAPVTVLEVRIIVL